MFVRLVMILENLVYAGLPMWASNALILVVALGTNLIDSITFATIVAESGDDQSRPHSMAATLRFIV